LSIAQWLAQRHGGRIEVASQVGQGSIFTVWLPLQPTAADL
jgi:signal transduction histidine kinase